MKNPLGIQVDRTKFLWRPLSKRQKRLLATPLGMLGIAIVAIAAFLNLSITGAVSGTASGLAGVKLDAASDCSMSAGIGSCTLTYVDDVSFTLALGGQDDDSQARVNLVWDNIAASPVDVCLAADPVWPHGAVTLQLGSGPGALVAPGVQTNSAYFLDFDGILANADLAGSLDFVFEEQGGAACP